MIKELRTTELTASSHSLSKVRASEKHPVPSDASYFDYGRPGLIYNLRLPKALRFLDSDYCAGGRQAMLDGEARSQIDRWFPFLFLHVFAGLALFYRPSLTAIWVMVGLYFVRMFAITAFYHRYFSHRTFKTSRFCQFLFAFWGGLSVQRGALWWASHHRNHHRNSDTALDIHSPVKRGFIWSHIGWITAECNMPTRYEVISDLVKFPELVFLNRFDWLPPICLAAVLYLTGCVLDIYCPATGTSGVELLLWGFFVSTVVLFHGVCSINSLSHIWGGKRYETGDESRNNFFLALLTLGEGWHNNHHRFPGSVKQGFFKGEIDITYGVLKVMQWCHLVSDFRPVPQEAYDQEQFINKDLSRG